MIVISGQAVKKGKNAQKNWFFETRGCEKKSKMAANNPRKFKDRIAQLAQKQAEGTAQFQEVMREVAEVKKTTAHPVLNNSNHQNSFGGGPTAAAQQQQQQQQQHRQPQQQQQQQQQHHVMIASSEGMMIPRHLSPVQLPPQPHYRYTEVYNKSIIYRRIHTIKKVCHFHVPNRDVTNQTLPWLE